MPKPHCIRPARAKLELFLFSIHEMIKGTI